MTSLALIPLRSEHGGSGLAPAFGLLVLGSPDAHRFHSGMGTDFLSRIGDLASAALVAPALSSVRQPGSHPSAGAALSGACAL